MVAALADVAVEPIAVPWAGGWRNLRAVAGRRMPVPVTLCYVMALLTLGTLLSAQPDSTQTRILLHLSTNLHNLRHGHLGTLLSSAFVTDGPAWEMVPLIGCVLVLAELRFGSRRMVEAFMAGHLGATLLVATGLYFCVHVHLLEWKAVGLARDVGVSYGTMALIGAFTVVLPHRWRVRWAQLWLALAGLGIALGGTFTNVGHCVSLIIGLLFAVFMIRTNWVGRRATRDLTKPEWALMAASVFVGGCFLLL